MTKKIQKIICVLAVVSGIMPVGMLSPAIWDLHREPSRFSSVMIKSATGGVSGALALALAVFLSQGKTKNTSIISGAALLGGIFFGGITYASCRNNTPEMWLTQFFAKFNEIASHVALAKSSMSNAEWVIAQGSLEDLEGALRILRKLCTDIPKLQRVVDVLISLGLDEFRPETLVDLRVNKEQLLELYRLALTRCAWASTTVDYENFKQLYAKISQASVLSSSLRDEWMEDAAGVQSFKHLRQALADLTTSFACIEGIVNRLRSTEAQLVLTTNQQLILAQAFSCLVSQKELCDSRLAFVSARAEYQDFNELYQVCIHDPVLQISGIFGDDDAWFMLNGVQRNLLEVTSDLKRRDSDMQKGMETAQRLLKSGSVVYFSALECSEIAGKYLVLRDLLALCHERQRMVVGLQKIEGFVVEYMHGMANRLAQESSFGGSDLSWMQLSRNSEWPLEDVCVRLRLLKSELSRALHQGKLVARSSDLQRLSESRKNVVKSRIDSLRRAINLVDQRLAFVVHSTMYAEEVAKRRSLETARQEQLERDRRAREEAANRTAEQRAHNRDDRVYRELRERKRAERDANTNKTAPNPAPSAPPALESCFCGDDISAGQEYVLSCNCKSSFYHRDCIQRWVASSKTCPMCRARAAVADIKKYEKPQPAPVVTPAVAPTAPPLDFPLMPVVPQAPVAASQPQPQAPVAQGVEAEECYLCMDSDNVADCTTANCDCTVKKPACRSCLQAWLTARNTCPRCQKTGATLVPFVSA